MTSHRPSVQPPALHATLHTTANTSHHHHSVHASWHRATPCPQPDALVNCTSPETAPDVSVFQQFVHAGGRDQPQQTADGQLQRHQGNARAVPTRNERASCAAPRNSPRSFRAEAAPTPAHLAVQLTTSLFSSIPHHLATSPPHPLTTSSPHHLTTLRTRRRSGTSGPRQDRRCRSTRATRDRALTASSPSQQAK